jgi:hypothetical protein
MKLEFVYSLDSETENVRWLIANREKPQQAGLTSRLPEKFLILSDNALSATIKEELDIGLANKVKQFLLAKFEEDWAMIDKFLSKLPYPKPDSLIVTLTRYGVKGLYWLPNKVVVRIDDKDSTYRAMIHEMIHCLIEKPVIEKYDVDYQTKESLVRWLMINDPELHSLFPNEKLREGYHIDPSVTLLNKIGWQNLFN